MDTARLSVLEKAEFEEVRGPEALEDIQEHLALYLLKGDLCEAKFLWKRIPNAYKESQELTAIWGVGQALWLRDMPEFYNRGRSFEWSPRIQPIMINVLGSVQDKMVRLIGTAYTSIRPADAATLLGVTVAEMDVILVEKGWTVVDGLIQPREPPSQNINLASAECQIGKLTDFVSVLEN